MVAQACAGRAIKVPCLDHANVAVLDTGSEEPRHVGCCGMAARFCRTGVKLTMCCACVPSLPCHSQASMRGLCKGCARGLCMGRGTEAGVRTHLWGVIICGSLRYEELSEDVGLGFCAGPSSALLHAIERDAQVRAGAGMGFWRGHTASWLNTFPSSTPFAQCPHSGSH